MLRRHLRTPFILCVLLWASCASCLHAQSLSERARKARLAYYYLESQNQSLKGNKAEEMALLMHCLDIEPNAPEALASLSIYYFALGDSIRGQQCIKKASDLTPDNYWYKQLLAQSYVREGNSTKAIETYEDLAHRHHDKSDALAYLASLYSKTGQTEKAIEALDRFERIKGKSPELTNQKVRLYLGLKKPKKAVAEMQSLVKEYPYEQPYKLMLAELYQSVGKPKEALKILTKEQALSPGSPALQVALASYYNEMKDSLRTRTLYWDLLDNPNATTSQRIFVLRQLIFMSERGEGIDSTEVQQAFARQLAEPQLDDELLRFYGAYLQFKRAPQDSLLNIQRRILEVTPESIEERTNLMSHALQTEDYKELIALTGEGLHYHPQNLPYYFLGALAHLRLDADDEALELCQQGIHAVENTPVDRPDLLAELYAISGDILHQKGENQAAYVMYDSCLVYNFQHTTALNNYAYYLSLEGKDLEKAEEMSYRSIKAEPTNKTFLDTYAWILFEMERYAEAKEYADKLLIPAANDSLDLNDVVLEHIGDIYYKNDLKAEALDFWQKAALKGSGSALLGKKIKLKKYLK